MDSGDSARIAGIASDVTALHREMSRLKSQFTHVMGIANRANERIDNFERKVAPAIAEIKATLNEFYSKYQEEVTLRRANEELSAAEREWEQKFGRYREVREIAANIIDIVGNGFIGAQALTDATERHALRTPRYWLAPATLAVAALLSGREDAYHSSMESALDLDRSKTALFMALLLREQQRGQVVEKWVDTYLSGLDPTDLPKGFSGRHRRRHEQRARSRLRSTADPPAQRVVPGRGPEPRRRGQSGWRVETAAAEPGGGPRLREGFPVPRPR
jgi:hypothetical protein